jgi:hydantoinase/carbamoylase family amidase
MILPHLKINTERLQADFEEISQIGLTEDGGISRLALSREDLQARAWLADQIETAGLLIHDDDAGNLSGILRSENPGARTVLIGSHLDTVPNAGRYDGVLGVLAGLECLRTIRESGIQLPVHLEVMDFTDDEGAWEPMFGSMSLTKRLSKDVLSSADPNKSAFRAALRRAGINPDEVHRAARDPRTIAAYIEMHVEQGARLEHSGADIGVVTAIVGRTSYRLNFVGQAGHGGTASMHNRHDALQGACHFVTQAHDLIREEFPAGALNCGNLEVHPGALTIIPSEACVTIECRHPDESVLAQMETAVLELARDCAHQYRVDVIPSPLTRIPAAQMNPRITEYIEKACATLGVTYQELASYASHNAQIMSAFAPSGLFFIPSVGGISHNPAEYSEWDDVVNGTNVMLHTILMLALSE